MKRKSHTYLNSFIALLKNCKKSINKTCFAKIAQDSKKQIYKGEFNAFSSFDRFALSSLIKRIDKPFLTLCEIGSWIGNGSTKTIIEEILNANGVLFCIDHWRGSLNVDRHLMLANEYDIFNTFKQNVSSYGGFNIVKPLAMSSKDAAGIIKDQCFDLIFIDGDHSYDVTSMDIELWLPKVVEGGILCGHDCEGRLSSFNKDFLWANRNNDTVSTNNISPKIHPGVILAVEEKFEGSAHLWAEETIKLDNGLTGTSSIWDVSVGNQKT
jgi:Methyltransferase domain